MEQPRRGDSTKWSLCFMASTAGEGNYSGTWVRNSEKLLRSSSWVCPLVSFCPPQCPPALVRVSSWVVRGPRPALGWAYCIGDGASFLPSEVSPATQMKHKLCIQFKWAAKEGLIIVWISFSVRAAAFPPLLHFLSKSKLGLVTSVG